MATRIAESGLALPSSEVWNTRIGGTYPLLSQWRLPCELESSARFSSPSVPPQRHSLLTKKWPFSPAPSNGDLLLPVSLREHRLPLFQGTQARAPVTLSEPSCPVAIRLPHIRIRRMKT